MVIIKYDDYLFEQLINEEIKWSDIKGKINIDNMLSKILNKIKTTKKLKEKVRLLTIIFFIYSNSIYGTLPLIDKEISEKDKEVISNLAKKEDISKEDITYTVDYLDFLTVEEKKEIVQIVQIDTNIINKVNKIKPGFLTKNDMEIYNQHDKDIISALKGLENKGETPDYNMVKTIMLIETGMKPRKNSSGFEGFPQTKKKWINWINDKYKTDFTMDDMYNPHESAKFIHYYIKALNKSKFVNDSSDVVIAYNWGTTNLIKYKQGSKKLPKESKDYVSMLNVITQNT